MLVMRHTSDALYLPKAGAVEKRSWREVLLATASILLLLVWYGDSLVAPTTAPRGRLCTHAV